MTCTINTTNLNELLTQSKYFFNGCLESAKKKPGLTGIFCRWFWPAWRHTGQRTVNPDINSSALAVFDAEC